MSRSYLADFLAREGLVESDHRRGQQHRRDLIDSGPRYVYTPCKGCGKKKRECVCQNVGTSEQVPTVRTVEEQVDE